MSIGSEITQLLLNQGNIAANRAERQGQITGQTIAGVGQSVGNAITQATDPKMQEYRRQQQGRAALTQILKTTPPTADGTPDHSAIVAKLGAQGFPDVGEAWLSSDVKNRENIASLSKMKQEAITATKNLQEKQMETIGDAAHHADTPEKFLATVGYLAAHQQIDEKTSNDAMDQAQAGGPDGWKAVREKFLQYSPEYKKQQEELRKPMEVPEGGSIRNAAGTLNVAGTPKPLTAEEVALAAAGVPKGATPTQEQAAATVTLTHPRPADSDQKQAALIDGKPGFVLVDPKKPGDVRDLDGKPIQNAAQRVKPIPSASAVSITSQTLSQAALDQAAQRFLDSGVLPPGMGMGAQRTAIQNRAAELDPKAALARNQAVFKADSANLTKLQTTEGTLSAFERAAGKNLDQFMSLADKVPDSGVPWINQPIRDVNAKGLGSADQAAFNAARDVALREIARVTNDPKLSGALTDSARKEVLGLIPADATFSQIKRVTKVLKQDMANVHSGLNDQIAAVKAGIGQNPNAPTAPTVPANVAAALKGLKPGIHTLSDGSKWMLSTDGSIAKQ